MTTSKEVENNHWKNPIFFHDKSAGESIARRNILQHNQDYIWQAHNNIILRKDMKQTFKVRKEEGLSTISIFHIVIKALAGVRCKGKKLKYINRKKKEVKIALIADNMVSQNFLKNPWENFGNSKQL